MKFNNIEEEDFLNIFKGFKFKKRLNNASIMITGFNGFLGRYIVKFLIRYKQELGWKKLILIDNFRFKSSKDILIKQSKEIKIIYSDILSVDLKKPIFKNINFIMHMASIASPHYYRKFPLETIAANVDGLKLILDRFKNNKVDLLYFSSSEIYGDPPDSQIPTNEEYRGNVSAIGPRSCYDESKRFCETLSYYYSLKFKISVKIVRPFNNFGPGLKLDDKRLPADLAKAILKNKEIILYSDGKPKRAFCYISDAITGYLQALTYEKFDIFNIGNDENEISVKELTKLYAQIGKKYFKYNKGIVFKKSSDPEYLTNNPNRRCPNINKAKRLLKFQPKVNLADGIKKYLTYNNSL